MEKIVSTMKKDNLSLKKNSLSAIRQILVTQYGVSKGQASNMIKNSGIELIFDRNAEIAAHTSYRTWAQRVYEQSRVHNAAPQASVRLTTVARRKKASFSRISSEKRA